MKFWVDSPFTFRDIIGRLRYVDPRSGDFLPRDASNNPAYRGWSWGPGNIFDTEDDRWHVPADFKPPLIGVRPMDAEAQAALNAARAGKTGIQLPGIGILPENEPIFVP